MRIQFVQTCVACPEYYDAFDESGTQVGYLRLRHGRFRVDFPQHGGDTIYEAHPSGDGAFHDQERDFFLQQTYNAIARKLSRAEDVEHSWYVVEDDQPEFFGDRDAREVEVQQQRDPRPTRADRAYERYVKPLERDHQDEYVLVTPGGQLTSTPTLLDAVRQASMRPNQDNFIFKVG